MIATKKEVLAENPWAAEAPDTKQEAERSMAAPRWLFNGWTAGGQQGGYVTSPPQAVLVHFIFLFTRDSKLLGYKLYGWWWP